MLKNGLYLRGQQLECYLKCHASGLGRICLRCDQLAGPCMMLAWCFWSCILVLHGVVWGEGGLFCGVCTVVPVLRGN